MSKTRTWSPCRVCGASHNNPASSSICSPCGATERAARLEAEEAARQEYWSSPFGQFMSMPEEDRWRYLFERLESDGVRVMDYQDEQDPSGRIAATLDLPIVAEQQGGGGKPKPPADWYAVIT